MPENIVRSKKVGAGGNTRDVKQAEESKRPHLSEKDMYSEVVVE